MAATLRDVRVSHRDPTRRLICMIASAAALTISPACRILLDTDSSACDEIKQSDLTFLETKVFARSCVFSSCHNGGSSKAGRLDLRAGNAFASLVDVDSRLQTDPQLKLVVPGEAAQSYLLVMIGDIFPSDASPAIGPPPTDIGLMPQDGGLLCRERRHAIERWIIAGALDN